MNVQTHIILRETRYVLPINSNITGHTKFTIELPNEETIDVTLYVQGIAKSRSLSSHWTKAQANGCLQSSRAVTILETGEVSGDQARIMVSCWGVGGGARQLA